MSPFARPADAPDRRHHAFQSRMSEGPDRVGGPRADRRLDETRIKKLLLVGERPHFADDLAKHAIGRLEACRERLCRHRSTFCLNAPL